MKTAIVTGVTGQDGAYLTKYLLGLGYRVIGTYRRTSSMDFWRLNYLGVTKHKNLDLIEYDLTDVSPVRLMQRFEPDEVYNLAGQSFVGVSFDQPITTAEITGMGPVKILEAIRLINPKIKFYQASTSEMFGGVKTIPQNEKTPFYPRSPYGVAKLYAHWMTINYRESYDMFCVSGILFNHESPLRGREFVTRKITHAVAGITFGNGGVLRLGNLEAKRDWGYAKEYVEGMHAMLQADTPDTYVLATHRTETVRSFVEMAFKSVNVDIEWSGSGEDEVGRNAKTGDIYVQIEPQFYRPAEVDLLMGDASKAKTLLGWEPKTTLEELCKIMVDADLDRLS